MQEVSVTFVSLSSAVKQQSEVVVTRNPEWNRIITLPQVKKGDQIIISTSNGGQVVLTYEMILSKAEDGLEFDVAVQNVPLASSLKISLLIEGTGLLEQEEQLLENRRISRKVTNNNSGGSGGGGGSASAKGKKGALSYEQISEIGAIILTNRACAINTVLSMMVIMAGISSLHAFGIDAFLFVLLSTGLSMYNLFQVIQLAKDDLLQSSKGICLRLIIHSHTFTSPDAPVNEPEEQIPQRFIDGCDGDVDEAKRRWDITRHWREQEGVNSILEEPQPYFHLIKSMWPHYFCGRGKAGQIVYYERAGEFEGTQLAARGVGVDQLLRHWLFMTEYQWGILGGGDETAKSISVLDLAGVGLSDLAGDNLTFLKKALNYANQHYPERSSVIFIVNAPYYFSMGWRLVKPMVHENTQKKIRILSKSETLKGLQEHIDFEQIPEYYGGGLDFGGRDSCRFHCKESADLAEFVKKVNEKNSIQTKVPFGGEGTGTGGTTGGEGGGGGGTSGHHHHNQMNSPNQHHNNPTNGNNNNSSEGNEALPPGK
jgi:uncharacterized membrane protein YgcG